MRRFLAMPVQLVAYALMVMLIVAGCAVAAIGAGVFVVCGAMQLLAKKIAG